jgi:hypothetical protein
MILKPEFMIVSGNGRNTGKTSFVERIIKKNCSAHSITAIKVSPHFHASENSNNLIESGKDFMISKETDLHGSKDSSRMMHAGASNVFYIEVMDEHLQEALQYLAENETLNGPVICESGGMRKLLEPSLFIMLTRPDLKKETQSFHSLYPMADHIVNFQDGEFDIDPEGIVYTGNRWEIRNS